MLEEYPTMNKHGVLTALKIKDFKSLQIYARQGKLVPMIMNEAGDNWVRWKVNGIQKHQEWFYLKSEVMQLAVMRKNANHQRLTIYTDAFMEEVLDLAELYEHGRGLLVVSDVWEELKIRYPAVGWRRINIQMKDVLKRYYPRDKKEQKYVKVLQSERY